MKNPFDLDVDNNLEEEYIPQIGSHAYQSYDGNRSLIQDERRRHDNPKDRFIGAIDQGTTSSRFIIFDCTGNPISKYQLEFRQIHERPG
jgi:glycerol kinase